MADPDYFTLAEFRLLPDMADEDTYTDDKVNAAAAYFTSIVENELGDTLLRASYTESHDGLYLRSVLLDRDNVVSLTSVTVDGATVNTALLTVNQSGQVRYLDGCTRFSGARVANVVVTYTAGLYATCPDDVKDAVMWATRDRLLAQNDQNDSDPRRTSVTTEMGTVSYLLPGEKRPTGFPELDAVIASRQRSLGPSVG